MKILIWNVNRAGASRPAAWEVIRREAPDIALLQEVTGLPGWVKERYRSHLVSPRYFGGHHAQFKSAILSKWPIDTTPFLASSLDWVNAVHRERYGWLLEGEVTQDDGRRLRLVSVHSPAFPVAKTALKGVDVSPINLTNNPSLWFTEILWSLLREADLDGNTGWIIGGDFNSSFLFDHPVDRGNRQVADRMNALGLIDCVRYGHGSPIPTFQHPGGTVRHQLDYCYVNASLLNRLTEARVVDQAEVFDQAKRLSDHLPIVCDFAS